MIAEGINIGSFRFPLKLLEEQKKQIIAHEFYDEATN